mmetsp:Transcript_144064/g.251415  ORF Transcript_144064/g.251415 Transcript_144064/m.251415 type:complete len:88 (+) Transcript_144064:665-928(+)
MRLGMILGMEPISGKLGHTQVMAQSATGNCALDRILKCPIAVYKTLVPTAILPLDINLHRSDSTTPQGAAGADGEVLSGRQLSMYLQ